MRTQYGRFRWPLGVLSEIADLLGIVITEARKLMAQIHDLTDAVAGLRGSVDTLSAAVKDLEGVTSDLRLSTVLSPSDQAELDAAVEAVKEATTSLSGESTAAESAAHPASPAPASAPTAEPASVPESAPASTPASETGTPQAPQS